MSCLVSRSISNLRVVYALARRQLYTSPLKPRLPPPTARRAEIMTFQFSIPCFTLPRGQNTLPTGQTGDQNYALCPAIPNCKSSYSISPSFSQHCRDCKKVIASHFCPANLTLPRRWGRGSKWLVHMINATLWVFVINHNIGTKRPVVPRESFQNTEQTKHRRDATEFM